MILYFVLNAGLDPSSGFHVGFHEVYEVNVTFLFYTTRKQPIKVYFLVFCEIYVTFMTSFY